MPEWGVISVWDVDTIYKVPRMLHEQGLDGLICDKLRINTPPANLKRWDDLVYEVEHPQREVTIGMCGKYIDLSDSYKSLNEALRHAGIHNHARVNIEYVDSETLTADNVSPARPLRRASWCPAASASAASRARSPPRSSRASTSIPYLGICLGMQVATIEYARHKAGLDRRQQHRVRARRRRTR